MSEDYLKVAEPTNEFDFFGAQLITNEDYGSWLLEGKLEPKLFLSDAVIGELIHLTYVTSLIIVTLEEFASQEE